MPRVKAVETRYAKDGLVVIGIHSASGAENLATFLKEQKIEHPMAVETKTGTLSDNYRVTGYPTYTFIDRSGKIRFADILAESLDTAAAILVKEPAPK